MAKQNRTHTIKQGLTSFLETINKVAEAELGNLSPEKQAEANKIGLEAVKTTMGIIGDSNIITMAETQDDAIETMHQIDEILEGAGIDPVQFRRQPVLNQATAAANEQRNLLE